ncbi:MAG: alpha-ketoglutarate-dependent dioxygenase AlkB [Rhizobiaceae bacterium]|nr:alpha-ketoglutarate-dependent dioxygenase AlkB [Rhizobiaceae bacterium]
MQVLPNGLKLLPGFLSRSEQEDLLEEVRAKAAIAPLFVPKMPRTGKPMSVRMTNFGSLGWVTDKEKGYRYQPTHPETGDPWPDIPVKLLEIWEEHANYEKPPEACLVNYYEPDAKMGLHQDRDEEDFDAPVLSISLGDRCLFRYGGKNRNDPTKSFKLESGDVMLLSGASRLIFHGVDRIYPGTSTLLKREGRINLTLRRVTR